MKHFVLMLAFAAYLCADAAPPAVPTLYGYVAEADEARPTGLYTITPTANPTFTLVSSKIVANYGADFIGDTYYCVKGYSNGYGGEYVDLEQYSSETWERTRKAYGKMNHRATDLAYDPTTQTTYGCFLTYNDGEYEYATMDFDTGTRNTGKTLGQ